MNTPILAASVDSVRATYQAWVDQDYWLLRYYGLEAGGIDLVLEVKAGSPIKLKVADQSDGLPQISGYSYTARSSDMIPFALALEFMPYTDTTSNSRTFEVP